MTIKRSDNIKVAMQKVAMRFKTKLPVDFDLLSKYKHLGGENLNFLSHPGGRMLERMSGGRGNLTGKHTDSFLKQLAKEIKDLPVGGKADVAGFYPGRVTPDELARLAKDPKKLSAKPLSRELALFPLEKSTRPIQKGQRFTIGGDTVVLGPGGPQVLKGGAGRFEYGKIEMPLQEYRRSGNRIVAQGGAKPHEIEGSGRMSTFYGGGRGDSSTTNKLWDDLTSGQYLTSGAGGKAKYQNLTEADKKMMKELQERAQAAYALLKGNKNLPMYSASGQKTLSTKVQDAIDMLARRAKQQPKGPGLFSSIEKSLDDPAVYAKIKREYDVTKKWGGDRRSALMTVWDDLKLGEKSPEAIDHAVRYLNKKHPLPVENIFRRRRR